MKISSPGIVDGYILPKYGTFADEKDMLNGVPTLSLPIVWEDLPEGTKSLALVMQDYDAIPVCGFSWIHWLVANIDPGQGSLPEGASRTNTSLLQGMNSLGSPKLGGNLPTENTHFYGGPRPPDKDHEYELELFALDVALDLEKGFTLADLRKAMRGHVLDSAVLHGVYRWQQ